MSDADARSLPDAATRRIAPTLLLGVTEDMDVSREEVFGPVLSIHPYDDVDEAIEYVSSRPSPLVAYWYGEDSADFREFRRRTTSGGMTRNDFAVHLTLPDVPFGGVGRSGMGAYHGKAGFDTFSHRRAVAESRIPGSAATRMTPATFTAGARDGLRSAVTQAYREAIERLGR